MARSRRCRYCDSDMTGDTSAMGYMQNPFCARCLDERISLTPSPAEPERAVLVGRYFHFGEPEKEARDG